MSAEYPRSKFLMMSLGVLAGFSMGCEQSKGEVRPRNVMTEQQLADSRITIYNTPSVNLYLRKSVLEEFDVFKDASSGVIKGVVITLVDQPVISWNASRSFPEGARAVYQVVNPNPAEFPDEYWEKIIQYWKTQKSLFEESLAFFLTNPTREDLQRRGIVLFSGTVEDAVKMDRSAVQRAEGMIALYNDREKAIADFAQRGAVQVVGVTPPVGKAGMLRASYLESVLGEPEKQHPNSIERARALMTRQDLLDKYYLYLAVGRERMPDPKYSFPKPDDFEVHKAASPNSRYVIQKSGPDTSYREPPGTPGFTLRHELGHYGRDAVMSTPERDADKTALDSIIAAWEKYKKGRDARAYGFVFSSPKGFTISASEHSGLEI